MQAAGASGDGGGGRGDDGAASVENEASGAGGSSPSKQRPCPEGDHLEGTPTTCAATTDDEGEAEAAAEAETDSEEDYDHRFLPDETVLIFDWDDTMLPSSWVQDQGMRLDLEVPLPEQHRIDLGALARHVAESLKLAKQLGTVVLVTNAERGWIELSCQRFLPTVAPLLESVKLLSARSEYERPDLPSPFEWKLRAFGNEIHRNFASDGGHRKRNVLSVGDSAHEREAVLRVTACMPNCRTKSLKFVERPSIDQLCRQHQLISRCFRRIVHHDGNLDLCISAS